MLHDLKTALKYVWLVVSLVTGCAVVAPFVASSASLYSLFPVCEARAKYRTECPLCGMTTAFVAISRGHWHESQAANTGAIPVFLIWSTNAVAASLYWLTVACRALALWRAAQKRRISCTC
jgi:hypothetical protein